MMNDWFEINNIEEYDSPMLVVYSNRIKNNIALAKEIVGDVKRLRPHVKTNKMREVCLMMMEAGITKFKCATIAEAEMLGMISASDVLLSYQLVGPKMQRFISLIKTYRNTQFSAIVDDVETSRQLNNLCKQNNVVLSVYVDVNVGMNRTGIQPQKAFAFIQFLKELSSIHFAGFHVYDGHIRDSDFAIRKQHSDAAFAPVESLYRQALQLFNHPIKIVAGGTPTFPVHAQKEEHVECSPGTFVFSDWGYHHILSDEPFEYAALVVARVISVIDEETICVDLGHKSVAAENPLPRVHFLNAPDAIPTSQSEEHLVLKVPLYNNYKTGTVLYGVPVHICPTVALYDTAFVAKQNHIIESWKVIARDRSIGSLKNQGNKE